MKVKILLLIFIRNLVLVWSKIKQMEKEEVVKIRAKISMMMVL